MATRLETMNGEELLLVRILGGPDIQTALAQELDQRSLLGRPRVSRASRRERSVTARTGGRLVA